MIAAPTTTDVNTGVVSITGVGKDAPTKTNAHGGKQSASPYRSDLLPPFALLEVAKVLKHGADKYGENNWYAIPVRENLDHALTHILAYLAGDGSDDHIEHAACRILFALDQKASGREKKLQDAVKDSATPKGVTVAEHVVYVHRDGFLKDTGGRYPESLKREAPKPPTHTGFTPGDQVLVDDGDDGFYGVVTGERHSIGSWWVDVKRDGDSMAFSWLPEKVAMVRVKPAPKPEGKPLIGGFNKGDRVRCRVDGSVVGVCDHVSPCGTYIRLLRDGATRPDIDGFLPSQLEKI